MNVGDGEQRVAVAPVRSDQRSDVDVSGGDHAAEGRHDIGESLLGLQPIHVRLSGFDLGGLRLRVGLLFIGSLLRHRGRGAQRIPPRRRNPRQGKIRLGLRELALRHLDGLVELRSVDHGKHLALMDLGADVLAPLAHVALHLPVNVGAIIGVYIARKHQIAGLSSALRRHQRHRRYGLILGPAFELLRVIASL